MIGRVIPYHLDTFLLTSGRLIGMFIVSNSTLTYQEVNTSRPCHPTDLVYLLTCVEFVTNNLTATLNWNTTITSTLIYHQAKANNSSDAIFDSRADIRRNGTHFFAFRIVSGFILVVHIIDLMSMYSLLETTDYRMPSDHICANRPPKLRLHGNLAIPRCAATTSLRLAN